MITSRTVIPTLISFLITAVAVFAIPIVFVSEPNRSSNFGLRIVWAEFLALLLWVAVGVFATGTTKPEKRGRDIGGILPAIGAVVIVYTAASFVLMIIHAYLGSGDTLDRLFTVLQILAGGAAGVSVTVISFAHAGGAAGTDAIPQDIRTPTQLQTLIEYHTQHAANTAQGNGQLHALTDQLKILREKIAYSLPTAGAIAQVPEYRHFAVDVARMCEGVGHLPPMPSDEAVDSAREVVGELVRRVEVLAKLFIR